MTFAEMCLHGYIDAYQAAGDFVPSMAQLEAGLQPTVNHLKSMSRIHANEFMLDTWNFMGAGQKVAVRMYIEQMQTLPATSLN